VTLKLEPPDVFHLSSALGWMELGLPTEAEAELAKISEANQLFPEVLEVRWTLLAHAERWSDALKAARSLVEVAPECSSGWLHRAYALRRAPEGGVSQALEALQPAFEKFPREPVIPYNLACYLCQLNRLDEARQWFKCAIEIADAEKIKEMALNDSDLEPLWEEIRQM
jgi:Flp pilus assembly protein TadD